MQKTESDVLARQRALRSADSLFTPIVTELDVDDHSAIRTPRESASIVVVDAEIVVRELFSIWLEDAGHRVRVADNGVTAQAMLDEESADVLVSDVRMTQGSGLDLLYWAREHYPDMPVVLATGRPAVETAVDALRLGAYDFLVKPVDQTDLLRVIERAISHLRLVQEKRRLEEENELYRQHLEELVGERTLALNRRNQQLLLINDIAETINSLDDLDTLYSRVVEAIRETFGYSDVSLFSLDRANERLVLESISSKDAGVGAEPRTYSQAMYAGLLGRAVRDGEPIVANDVTLYEEFIEVPGRPAIRSESVFPIRVGEEFVALLAVSENRPDAFDDVDVMVLKTLVDHLSVAIGNVRLYTQLQEALMAREQMLANVSHELRSPLSVISAWAEMLSDGVLGPLDDDAGHAATNILTSAHHLTHLVNLLLTFQGLEGEQLPLHPVMLPILVESIVSSWRPILQRENIRLTCQVGDGVGYVSGNEDYLRQVINNLLDNARKFSPGGGTTRVMVRQSPSSIQVTVADDGVGVEPERLTQLFDRFYQVDGGITRRFEGMGLGLSLSHEIVRRLGGRIWAQSEGAGKGMSVTFILPSLADPDFD